MFDAHPCAVMGLAVLPRTTPSMTLFVTSAADCVMRVWDYGRRRLVCRRTFATLASLQSSLSSDVAGQGSPLVDADGDECVARLCLRACLIVDVVVVVVVSAAACACCGHVYLYMSLCIHSQPIIPMVELWLPHSFLIATVLQSCCRGGQAS